MAKRSIDCRALNYEDAQSGGANLLKQNVKLRSGISKEDAKKITKLIKATKLKVQSQIQDDQVRVTGKKIDDLQMVIEQLKSSDLGLPLQFVNMR